MFKNIFILLSIFVGGSITGVANGASMCIPNGTYFVMLAPERNGIASTSNGNGTFMVTFDYVTAAVDVTMTSDVVGIISCNNIIGTTDSTAGNISASSSDTGTNCWCGLIRPLITAWAFTGQTYSTDADCASGCLSVCMNKIQTSIAFRTALYNAIVW